MGQPDNDEKIKEIDTLMSQVFSSISFEKGEVSHIGRFKEFFVDGGILINYNGQEPLVFGVEDFIEHFKNQISEGIMSSLEDKEILEKTEIYGNIAHRYSFYEARHHASDTTPFAVGVNSIQLIRINGYWRITSMSWNDDRKEWGFFSDVVK